MNTNIYVIYLSGGKYWDGSKFTDKPQPFTASEARQALFNCQKVFRDRSTLIRSAYEPAIRLVKSLNPVIFARESLNTQTEMFSAILNQAAMQF